MTETPNVWERMKRRWGVSNWGAVAIVVAFSLAGSTVVRISHPVVDRIVGAAAPRWLWWTVRILVIVPAYQVILMIYGTLLGQFRFFWNKERQMGRAMMKLLRVRR